MTANFIQFTATTTPEALSSFGPVQVVAMSSQPFGTNADVRAWVGSQELIGISVDQFGLSFTGYVATIPSGTDTLSVQIDSDEKIDTGLTRDEPLIS
jgi:hypothetical protein